MYRTCPAYSRVGSEPSLLPDRVLAGARLNWSDLLLQIAVTREMIEHLRVPDGLTRGRREPACGQHTAFIEKAVCDHGVHPSVKTAFQFLTWQADTRDAEIRVERPVCLPRSPPIAERPARQRDDLQRPDRPTKVAWFD